MKRSIFFIFAIFLINFIYAQCSENQININTAPKDELIKIKYIGDSRADELISLRPFNSVDELIKIKGIGEVYLERIKEQNLACVDIPQTNELNTSEINESKNQDKNKDFNDSQSNKDEKHIKKKTHKNRKYFNEYNNSINKTKNKKSSVPKISLIRLNPQIIKTVNSEKNKEKRNYALQGFIAFSFLIIILSILKYNKDKKNEFA